MKTVLSLLVTLMSVSCSAPASTMAVLGPDASAPHDASGIESWIPDVLDDLGDVIEINVGNESKYGFHVKATDLFQLGVWDWWDVTLFGFDMRDGDWDMNYASLD